MQSNPVKVDIWHRSGGVGIPFDISGRDEYLFPIIERLTSKGTPVTTLISDVQSKIEHQMKTNVGQSGNGTFDYSKYHTLEEIQSWCKDIAANYSRLVRLLTITKSYEEREMYALQLSVSNSTETKPAIWIEGGIHAREWISPATVIYMTAKLLEGYGTDEAITTALNDYDWYIVPVVNVDGYRYTWVKDRMWRKTRTKHLLCYGSDPNRNWDYHWCEGEKFPDPCSDSYCGPKPFSEPVVKGVADFISSKEPGTFKIFIDFHSYSQLWMTPWAYTTDKPKDYAQQEASAMAAVDALTAVHGTKYKYGPIATTIYIAKGSSADWTYGNASIKYSYGVELRDEGQYGFLLPADQIIPSGEETLQGLLALTQFVTNNP